MALPNIFTQQVANDVIGRINKLTVTTNPQWGKMNVAQMLAHCNVTYEMVYDTKHPAPGGFAKLMLKLFVKNLVVNEAPYKKNSRTAPAFLVSSSKDFEIEKGRLINYIKKTQQLGEKEFDNKASLSFGPLSSATHQKKPSEFLPPKR